MSERARRRSSKWDLKDDNPLSPNHIRVSGRELDKASSWDEDGGYGTRMSPGLGDWRKQRGRSPRDKWDRPARNRSRSRSRSRSPARGFRQESGNNDRYRSRSGATCKDFSAGRCRRGDDCPFIHQGNRNYDDSREGGPRRSGASKYPNTHDARDYPPGRSSSDRERRWNNVTPCKFFAAGNCRSGKLCRFSHSRASESPDRKLDDEKAMLGHNSDRAAKIWEDPRFSETVSVPDAAKFDDADGRKGASDTRFDERCLDARWEQRLGPESRPIEKVIGDSDMSPDWNYGLNSSSHMEERVQHTYTIPAPEFNNESIPVKPGFSQSDMNFSANVLQLQNFEHNRQNITAIAPSSLNPVGQHDVALATDPRRERSILNPPNRGPLSEGKVVLDVLDVNKSQVTTLPPNKNMVSGEELTNISASLAQLLGAGRQLPQLYAALSATSDAASEVPVNSAIPIPLDVTIVPQKQYDPLCDSIEQQRANRPDNQQGISSSPVDSKRVVIREKEVRSSDLPSSSHADMSNNGSSERHISTQLINQLDPGGSSDLEENMEKAVAGSKNAEESKEAKDNGQPENVDGEKKDEENKKSKEAKATRAFKFALAEFVKDLLKPAWKEGLVGKDAYKTIVKKVVDKVTGTVQGANIPQTQEKIDNYLSLSKPKLTKLVQAYVEKFQKPK